MINNHWGCRKWSCGEAPRALGEDPRVVTMKFVNYLTTYLKKKGGAEKGTAENTKTHNHQKPPKKTPQKNTPTPKPPKKKHKKIKNPKNPQSLVITEGKEDGSLFGLKGFSIINRRENFLLKQEEVFRKNLGVSIYAGLDRFFNVKEKEKILFPKVAQQSSILRIARGGLSPCL